MSFRETSAWITFVTVLLTTLVYAGVQLSGLVHGHTPAQLYLLMACVIALIVIQTALHAVAAALSPADARGPKDERERAIQLRAFRVGYYVLVAGVLALFITGHLTFNAFDLMFHGLAALVLSTLSISLTQIVLFRLGR